MQAYQAIRNRDLLQRVTLIEGISANGFCAGRYGVAAFATSRELYQRLLVFREDDAIDVAVIGIFGINLDLFKLRTETGDGLAEFFQMGREGQADQCAVALEDIAANRRQFFRKLDILQFDTVSESVVVNVSNRIGDGDTLQTPTVVKNIAGNCAHIRESDGL